jgi:hypothetical protein
MLRINHQMASRREVDNYFSNWITYSLTEDGYNQAAFNMVPPISGKVHERLLRERNIFGDQGIQIVENSFASFMAEACAQKPPPDVFLLIAKSAIPIADALRGYFLQLSQPVPKIMAIHGERTIPKHTEDKPAYRARALGTEISGANVAIIDHYIASGGIMGLAIDAARTAGAKSIISVRKNTHWYQSAQGVDMDKLTSKHAEFMFAIGGLAAQLSEPFSEFMANCDESPTKLRLDYPRLWRRSDEHPVAAPLQLLNSSI